jgi:hypothetical protein
MANGAIEAMQKQGIVPGKDVIIGGVDATPQAMELIDQGVLHATVGGHFLEGGWVVVLLHDYLHGVDFADLGTHFESHMTLVTRKNLEAYRANLDPATWSQWDFRQLSRLYSPDRKDYALDIGVLIETSTPSEHLKNSNDNDGSKVDNNSH